LKVVPIPHLEGASTVAAALAARNANSPFGRYVCWHHFQSHPAKALAKKTLSIQIKSVSFRLR
jgi:hypothetical protein